MLRMRILMSSLGLSKLLPSSDVSDLDKFEEAYEEFGKLTAGVDTMALDRHLAGNKSDDVPVASFSYRQRP